MKALDLQRIKKTKREKKRWRKRLGILFGLAVLMVVGFFILMNRPYVLIQGIDIKGNEIIFDEDINTIIETELQKKVFGFIPQRNMFFYPQQIIKKNISQAYPIMQRVTVDLHEGDRLLVEVLERKPHSLWCVEEDLENIFDEECYFADYQGFLYSRAPYFSENVFTKFYGQIERDGIALQGQVGTEESFQKLFDFINGMKEQGLGIRDVVFHEFNDVALTVRSVRGTDVDDVAVLYNAEDEFNTVIRNLEITIEYQEFQKKLRDIPEQLKSIDLRFPGRIFYTFLEYEEPEEPKEKLKLLSEA